MQFEMRGDRGSIVVEFGGPECVAFPPDAEAADIDERNMGRTVIPRRRRDQEIVELGEKDRVVEIGLPAAAVGRDALARCEAVSLGACLLNPSRCGVLESRFARREAESDLLALGDPTLRRSVDHGPVKAALLRLNETPGEPQIDHRDAREVIDSVVEGKLGPVLFETVVVVVEHPSH